MKPQVVPLFFRKMIDLTAFYPDTAPHRLKKPNKKFQGRTFARTARTDNSNGLSFFNGKGYMVKDRLVPKGHVHVLKFNYRFAHISLHGRTT